MKVRIREAYLNLTSEREKNLGLCNVLQEKVDEIQTNPNMSIKDKLYRCSYIEELNNAISSVKAIDHICNIIGDKFCDDPILSLFSSVCSQGNDYICQCLECGKIIIVNEWNVKEKRILKSDLELMEVLKLYNELRGKYDTNVDFNDIYYKMQALINEKEQELGIQKIYK